MPSGRSPGGVPPPLVGINTGMKNLDLDCYHALHRRGLTSSRRHFSREWLGAAENYSCSRAGRGLSPSVGLRLCARLWDAGFYILALRVGWGLMRSVSTSQAELGS